MASPGLVNVQTTGELGNRSFNVFQKFGLANVRAMRERGNDLDAFVLFADSGWARVGLAEDRAAITGETFTALQDAIAAIQSDHSLAFGVPPSVRSRQS